MIEPVSTMIVSNLFGWAIGKVADTIWQGASDTDKSTGGIRIKQTIHKSDIERGIRSGLKAVEEWQKYQNPQHLPFYSMSPDGYKGVPRFLEKVFNHSGVQQQLRRPFEEKKPPEVNCLVVVFKQVAKDKRLKLNTQLLDVWIQEFVKGYFQATTAYLSFKIKKKCYLEQLAKFYDDVKFAGIETMGEETEKLEQLVNIFVIPDVVEDKFNLNLWQRDLVENDNKALKNSLENYPVQKFSASQLLQQVSSKKAVLLGAPGSGKTTLLSYFAVMVARENSITETLGLDEDTDWLPILIKMRDFGRYSEISLLEYAKQFTEKSLCVPELPAGFFEYWLNDGRALILIDGLDEIANSAKRSHVVQLIDNFLHRYKKNYAIITSRPAGYRGDYFRTDEYPHFQIEEFDDEKIEKFIKKWYNSRVPDKVEAERYKQSLRKALSGNSRIQLLARNPLLLTIIALIHRYRGVLSKQRHQLYGKAVETLLKTWDANKDLTNHKKLKYLDLDDLQELMEQLAYWIHTQGNTTEKEGGTLIEREELIKESSKKIENIKGIKPNIAQEEAERFIDFIRERTGLLNEQGIDYYAFVHKTFQEYLCAKDINERANRDFEIILASIRDYLHEGEWREVLLLLIAQQKSEDAAKAIREILNQNSEYEQWLHRDLLFAGYCLTEDPRNLNVADKTLAEEILQQLIELDRKPGKLVGGKVRQQVFKIIGSLSESQFEKKALQLLKANSELIDPNQFLRYRVALGEKKAVIQKYLQRLQDNDSNVRFSAARTLGELGNSSKVVVKALVSCLSDHDSGVRYQTALVLGKLGNPSAAVVEALVSCLNDHDSGVRFSAAWALAKLGNPSPAVLNNLVSCLSDHDSGVRFSAASALGQLGNPSPAVLNNLVSCLSDHDSIVRISAASALGQLGNSSTEIVDTLVSCLSDHDSIVRFSATRALGELGNSSKVVVDTLVSCLSDHDSGVRISAASALGQLGNSSTEIVEVLVLSCLSDHDSGVRISATRALGELGNSSKVVVKAFVSCLSDHDSGVCISAAWALAKLGNFTTPVVKAFVSCLSDHDSSVRISATRALVKLGKQSDKILPCIIQWLEQHQDSEYIGNGIDVLWDLVVEE
ncbi:MAG: HEAT repeat domain-containing protein [Microcoleaceae cyanobacterium]